MMKFADFKKVVYLNNAETGYFQKQPSSISFQKLPFELRIEETRAEQIKNNAEFLIRGKEKNKKTNEENCHRFKFMTGLIPIDASDVKNKYYMGNYCEYIKGKRKISLILFVLSNDSRVLTVYFFNHFNKEIRAERISYLQSFIAEIL